MSVVWRSGLLVGLVVSACTFDGAPAQPIDAGPDVVVDASVDAQPSNLITDGLLVRYFASELATGPGSMLQDAASSPLNLSLVHQPTVVLSPMRYCEPAAGQRGLCWSELASSSMASVDVDGTKLAGLEGATAVTTEAIVTIEDSDVDWSRIMQIGLPNIFQDGFALLARNSGEIAITFGSFAKIVSDEPLPGGRFIIHAVANTSATLPAERLRLFINGEPIDVRNFNCGPGTACGFPIQNAELSVAANVFAVGNRAIGERSFQGTLHYMALYERALTEIEIERQTSELTPRDD